MPATTACGDGHRPRWSTRQRGVITLRRSCVAGIRPHAANVFLFKTDHYPLRGCQIAQDRS